MQELIKEFEELANNDSTESIEKLKGYLLVREGDPYEKHTIPHLACRALLSKGIVGVQTLTEVLIDAPGVNYPIVILASLWQAGDGKFTSMIFANTYNSLILEKEISNEVRNAARDSFFDFLDECKTNPESFHRLINLLYQEQVLSMSDRNNNQRFQQSLFRILAESSTTVTNHKISKFEKLLKDRKPEEEYQIFLMDNPVFLNPLASKLIPKKKLGEEFITDYVLETLSSEYILVEIEKPSDQIFTKSNDFHHKFTHAFGQVLDFIEWVEQNIAYAQKKLPNISSPTGLLIIGMREYLNDEQIKN